MAGVDKAVDVKDDEEVNDFNQNAADKKNGVAHEDLSGIRRNSAAGIALNLLQIPYNMDRPKSPGVEKLSPFQKQKINYMFDTLYAPQDNDTVTRDDFWRLLKLAAAIRQWAPTHAGFQDFRMRIASIWAGLIKGTLVYKASTNALVMEITREEWQHYWGDFVESARLNGNTWPATSKDGRIDYQCQKDFKDFMFTVMDVNGDGSLDHEEFRLSLTSFGLAEFTVEQAYFTMCKGLREMKLATPIDEKEPLSPGGGSIYITEEVFDELWFQYLTSEDEDDPGNYLLGKPSFT